MRENQKYCYPTFNYYECKTFADAFPPYSVLLQFILVEFYRLCEISKTAQFDFFSWEAPFTKYSTKMYVDKIQIFEDHI